jgi:hypothetical protein
MFARKIFPVMLVAVAVGSLLPAQDGSTASRILFIGEDNQGKVWANLSLTLAQQSEPYLPMVVGVQNKSSDVVKLDRDSFYLTDLDGIVYPIPSVRDWRKNYDRIVIDRRMMNTGGIPWEVWWRSRKFSPSNFFPDLRATRGNTTQDSISLRTGFGMVDLMYFERLRTPEIGKPFFLTVRAEGWEVPITLRLFLS